MGEDRTRFPSGLRALADYVRSKGMQFGLWFEPERTGPESLLARQHPDWIIYAPKRKWGVVNFGKPEVQEYFEKTLDRFINEYGLRYVRWDNNSELLDYWSDPPGRGGITQIRHLEGVHRVEEWVLEHHPDLIFENCAGGGQRIDLQSLTRRQTIWISDQTMDPDIVRFHLEGLNNFVTGNRQMVAFSPPISTYQKPGFNFPDIAFQSYFGGAFGTAGRLQDWPQQLRLQVRKHVEAYKKVRRFLADDYYLLMPQARTLEGWEGWQFQDPKAQEGFVQAFRMRSPNASQKLVLHGLDTNARYEFSDVYTGKTFKISGNQLALDGLEFNLSQNSSQVLLYRRIP
jgi:alpha-galactosidase